MTTGFLTIAGHNLLEVAILVLALLGAGLVLFFVYELLQERRLLGDVPVGPHFGFDPDRVDRGTPLVDFLDEEAIRSLTSKHEIELPPSKEEEEVSRGFGLSVKGLFGKQEKAKTKTTEPPEDLGQLLLALLAKLDTENELALDADCVPANILEAPAPLSVMNQEEGQKFLESWLADAYPEGFSNISARDLAFAISGVGKDASEERIRDHMRHNLESLDRDDAQKVLFMEGQWRIEANEDRLVLARTDLRVAHGPYGHRSGFRHMPSGLSIRATVATDSLTRHGRDRMVGVPNRFARAWLAP